MKREGVICTHTTCKSNRNKEKHIRKNNKTQFLIVRPVKGGKVAGKVV